MTQDELVANIEKDIEQKGSAHVPMNIIREVFSDDMQNSPTFDDALEEFASSHGWHVRHEALPIPRVIFSHV